MFALAASCGGSSSVPPDDAAADDAAPVRAHCRGAGPAPAWATVAGDGSVRVACSGASLEVVALLDATARLDHVATGASLVERPWAQVDAPGADPDVRVGADGDDAEVCAPALVIRVTRDCRVEVRDAGGHVVLEDGAGGGFRAEAGGARLIRRTPPGERIYGLGERTGGLDRRGRTLTFWNTDAYDPALGGWRPDADPLYQSIPFAVTLREGVAAGVLTDDTRRLTMDLAVADDEQWAIHTPARALRQYVIAGPSMREVVRRYTAMTGRTPLPPAWALGYHQCRWGYAPASRLTDLAAEFRARDLAATSLWLDIQHMRGFRTFTFDPQTFPDPAGLAAALAGDGFALVAIADPGIKVDPGWDVYDELVAGGHALRTPAGAVFEGTAWPGPSAFPDVTRAETRAWWAARVAGLVALGVDGIWLDVNEPTTFPEGGGGTTVPDELPVAGAPGATMAEVHNVYAVLQAQATWEGMRAAAPGRRPFVLSRAGAPGIQRWAAVWTGDTPSTWSGLRATLPMMLGLGLSGVPFVGSDVGGYSGRATPELFARWMAVGAVSPFFRGHVTQGVPDQEPWSFGPEVEEISRRMIAERERRMPYLYGLFAEAERSGLPVLRPLVMEFQHDPGTWDVDDQAMLGPHLLVAPGLEPGATSRTVYLPPGRWIEARSGAVHVGPAMISVDMTLQALPTFLREGAIVPGGGRGGDPLVLDVHPGAMPGAFVLHEDAGDGAAYTTGDRRNVSYLVERTASGAILRAERAGGTRPVPARELRVRIRPVDGPVHGVDVDGAPLGAGAWWHDPNDRALWIVLPDRDDVTIEASYDQALSPALRVRVPVEVELPPGTPADQVIHLASSATGWTHVPLTRIDATHARGELEVDRGAWFFYKYSRGGWDTVEKDGACGEISNRYRFGAADDRQVDVVARWRDGC